jgi:hypothetical protein
MKFQVVLSSVCALLTFGSHAQTTPVTDPIVEEKETTITCDSDLKRNPKLHVAMIMGATDNNRAEVKRTEAEVGRSRFRSFEFTGGHTWAPAETFEQAMSWIKEKSGSTGASSFGR